MKRTKAAILGALMAFSGLLILSGADKRIRNLLQPTVYAATFTVTNTGDNGGSNPPAGAGTGTLRQALVDANAAGGTNVIVFSIPGAGVQTINISLALPAITSPVTIDGWSQGGAGYTGPPLIELKGPGGNFVVNGLRITAGSSTVRGLVINRFNPCIRLDTNGGNVIAGNYIGTDPSGTMDLGSATEDGLLIVNSPNNTIGGTGAASRNIIAGHNSSGIEISGGPSTGNQILGNYIGTDVTGTNSLGNGNGVFITFGASNNAVGGSGPGAGNIISGNATNGIDISSGCTGNQVQGNLIGTNAAGTADLGNSFVGVRITGASNTIGGASAGARNVISGNDGAGVEFAGGSATGNLVQGNYIGADVSGMLNLGNSSSGVNLIGGNNTIGGVAAGEGNLIAFNLAEGVHVEMGATGSIRGNSIHSNAQLGINLVAAGDPASGVTPNDNCDSDFGPNALQNFPLVTSITTSGGNVVINGTLNSTASSSFTLDFYASPFCDPAGNGEGRVYIGSTNVNTDVGCNANFSVSLPNPNNAVLTATAINSAGGTSEFSPCANVPALTFIVTNTGDNGGVNPAPGAGTGTLRQAIIDANANPGLDKITFNIPGGGVHTIAPLSILPDLTNPVTVDGTTQPGFSGSPLIELDGTSAGGGFTDGLRIATRNTTIKGLAINRFAATGIAIFNDENRIEGNHIGTDASGTIDRGNNAGIFIGFGANLNTIGGTTPAVRNVISGNNFSGISIAGAGTTGNVVQGNFIGTDVGGLLSLGNSANGVEIVNFASSNAIGGTTAGAGNLIAFNGSTGVRVESSSINNPIRGNSIHSNGRLGIDLVAAGDPGTGVTPNDSCDSDSGANNLQNYPVLSSASSMGGSTTIQGTLNSTAAGIFNIDFYSSPSCDGAGNGEGRAYLGSASVATDSNCVANINVILPVTVFSGFQVTATATNSGNNTSEFSACITASGPTAVALDAFDATEYENGVLLEWRTGYEVNSLGFNIYREVSGRRTLINPDLIAGSALVVGPETTLRAGRSYDWWDRQPQSGERSVSYWLEEIDLNGRSVWYGPSALNFDNGPPPKRSQPRMLATLGVVEEQSKHLKFEAQLPGGAKPALRYFLHNFISQSHPNSLASQPTVKIQVKQEGWYKVPQAELLAAGVDPSVDPRLLQMYTEGQQIPITVVGESDGRLDVDDSIGFYGTGVDSPHTDTRVYFLVSGTQPGKRIDVLVNREKRGGARSFSYTVERKERSVYFAGLLNGEAENFFGGVVASQPVDQRLPLQLLDETSSTAQVEIALQGVTNLSHSPDHQVSVSLNGTHIGQLVFDGRSHEVARYLVPASKLREGENTLTLAGQGGGDVTLVDYVRISYQRKYVADSDELIFTASSANGSSQTIEGFSTGLIRVLDITDPHAVQEISGEVEQYKSGSFGVTVSVTSPEPRRFFGFTPDRTLRPLSVTANEASSWRNPNNQADLLIITCEEFEESLEPLCALRRSQGHSVAVIDVDDIYNEFSFGEKSPHAVKDFIRYAYTSWAKLPKAVLLAGDASYDSKNYLGFGGDLVPTKLIDTRYLETASDEWLADFTGDGVAELSIGRLPVRNAAEASTMVAKIVNYENMARTKKMLLVADENDGYDFEQAIDELQKLTPSWMGVTLVKRGRLDAETAKKALLDGINNKQLIVNYVGHGSINQWRGSLLTAEEARRLTNIYPSVFVMMTCLNGYFHDPAVESLAESLLKADRGGAIAVWASSGLTSPDQQKTANHQLYRLLFQGVGSKESPVTLGDVVLKAKATTMDLDVRRTWVLFGDPMMKLQ